MLLDSVILNLDLPSVSGGSGVAFTADPVGDGGRSSLAADAKRVEIHPTQAGLEGVSYTD
jgi:hypothetical protein